MTDETQTDAPEAADAVPEAAAVQGAAPADPSSADPSGADRSSADVSGADSSGVDSSGVDTSGVDSSSADSSGVDSSSADRAAAAATAAGYVLTRRDRTAIHFIDWAVKIGTPEFQERYRPVSDELFTHVYIDPTAKPAFVPPALVSVEQLNADSDPLEIIRSHLGLVIDDRRSRDKARLDLQAHLAKTEGELAEACARAADLDERLADTTARLETADARVVQLGEQLEAEVSGLHTSHAAELAATLGSHEASVAALTEERDRTLAELAADRDTTVATLIADRDAEVARLEAQLADDTAEQRAQHEAEIEALHAAHAEAVEAASVANTEASEQTDHRHSEALAALGGTHAAAIAALQADLSAAVAAAEATTVQLKEARLQAGSLTAQRDRAIAEGSEWRNRLYQTVGAMATTVDVGDWTNDNAPDERLIRFVEETRLGLTNDLESARATIEEIEEVATAQLVDETETSDYAIGANDASVLVLNALYGSVEDTEAAPGAGSTATMAAGSDASLGAAVSAGAGAGAAGGAGLAGVASDGAVLSESEEADALFEAELRDEVDVEFEEPSADAAVEFEEPAAEAEFEETGADTEFEEPSADADEAAVAAAPPAEPVLAERWALSDDEDSLGESAPDESRDDLATLRDDPAEDVAAEDVAVGDAPESEASSLDGSATPAPDPALIGHTAVIEHHIVRDETPEVDDVDTLGSLFADDTSETPVKRPGEREHRRAS